MNKILILLSSLFVFGLAGPQSHAANSVGYWYNSDGEIVRNSAGECWRTVRWDNSNSVTECEGKIARPSPAVVVSDADGDGVADASDQCPNTPKGATVDNRGCQKDADNDGIADSSDQCPRSKPGVQVDARGCEVQQDTDGDGIVDASDACPGTAKGVAVDKTGCKLKASISLENVQFETGTAKLSRGSQQVLDGVARTLIENTHLTFEVAGHTDNTGNYENNVKLSKARAQSVRQYLVEKGVDGARLKAHGYGPDKPIASNDTRDGRSKNRRVELVRQ